MKEFLTARTRRILLSDKTRLPDGFAEAVRRDVERVLSQYMTLCAGVEVSLDVDEGGLYRVEIKTAAEAIVPCRGADWEKRPEA